MSINTPNTNLGTNSESLYSLNNNFDLTTNTFKDTENDLNSRYSEYYSENYFKATVSNSIEISSIINEIVQTRINIMKIMKEIDIFLSKVYVNPDTSPDLDTAHAQVWNEVVNKNNTKVSEEISISNIPPAGYISYQEFCYAKEHKCRGCRALTMEYEAYVGKTELSYYYDIKTFLSYFIHELQCMNQFIINTIGDTYKDEAEKTIAKEFYFWTKSLKEYTKLFAQEITSLPPKLSKSEMDYVSKVQATQFEAFFSLKINSYESEIKKILGLVKKEMVDTCELYYNNFLAPALKSRSMISSPLEIDLLSSDMKNKAPALAKEVVIASSTINGNLASLMSDLRQKKVNIEKRIIGFLETVRLKRKYISFSRQFQLVSGYISPSIYTDVNEDNYSTIFEEVISFHEKNETLNSSHKYFNDLLEDDHPQYLLRSGGVVTGDIQLKDGVKIAGIDFANHSHSSGDGSIQIKISDIDYQTDRDSSTAIIPFSKSEEPISIEIDSYLQDILVGGVPVIDVLLSASINADTEENGRYDIIVSYVELEG